jgi:hypothetical protein
MNFFGKCNGIHLARRNVDIYLVTNKNAYKSRRTFPSLGQERLMVTVTGNTKHDVRGNRMHSISNNNTFNISYDLRTNAPLSFLTLQKHPRPLCEYHDGMTAEYRISLLGGKECPRPSSTMPSPLRQFLRTNHERWRMFERKNLQFVQ